MSSAVEIIPSHQINKSKWDACICSSSNALIYATSFYLDHMADNWHGIVVSDYDCVMPLPWRKKFGIKYCYDIPFIQQLGWFEQHQINNLLLLIKKFFGFYSYGDYAFNFHNTQKITNASICSNYVLDLSKSYNRLKENYNTDLIYNLKKAYKQELTYSHGEYNTAIDLYKDLYKQRMLHVSDKDFKNLRLLCSYLSKSNNVVVRNILNVKNELLAIALLLKDEKRLYNMMNSTTEGGRKTEANHFLFDSIFKEFSESNLLFDFEGSDIPGIKNFYEKFGAVNQPYYKLYFNHLPFPFNILKR
ncbi:MAG TPA: hypothetical protein VN958_20685 [Chitinophagaceae bacterium]|nr:hypothetical protein [Chitinophagaceae bacterium]